MALASEAAADAQQAQSEAARDEASGATVPSSGAVAAVEAQLSTHGTAVSEASTIAGEYRTVAATCSNLEDGLRQQAASADQAANAAIEYRPVIETRAKELAEADVARKKSQTAALAKLDRLAQQVSGHGALTRQAVDHFLHLERKIAELE